MLKSLLEKSMTAPLASHIVPSGIMMPGSGGMMNERTGIRMSERTIAGAAKMLLPIPKRKPRLFMAWNLPLNFRARQGSATS